MEKKVETTIYNRVDIGVTGPCTPLNLAVP